MDADYTAKEEAFVSSTEKAVLEATGGDMRLANAAGVILVRALSPYAGLEQSVKAKLFAGVATAASALAQVAMDAQETAPGSDTPN